MDVSTKPGGGGEPVETEWQFDALDLRPVERWLAALPSRSVAEGLPTLTVLAKPSRRLVDRYMDTADRRIGRAGLVLRTRQRGHATEVTMKDTRPASASGLRQRLELTESLPSGLASLGAAGPVGRRVRAVAGTRPLVEVLEVRTRRRPFSLRAAGAEVAEVALDDTTILVAAGEPPARLRRVEVEVVPEWVEALAPLVDDLREAASLFPAALSKFEAGMLAAGVTIPGLPDLGPTEAGPGATLGDLAYAVLRRQLRTVIAHEPGTRLGDDPEALHDMRVATRRLRAAFSLFSGAFPARAATLREELGWLAGALGAVRDLDVQMGRTDEMATWSAAWLGAGGAAALTHLSALLDAEREDARRHLLDALDSARFERLVAALTTLARQDPGRVPGARVPAAQAVPPLVLDRHRAMVKAAKRARRSQLAVDFHQVRVRGKRLRYGIEFSAALYGAPASKMAAKLTEVQDLLGEVQDAEVASSRLFALATGGAPEGAPATAALPPSTVFVLGGIAERYRQESGALKARAPGSLRALDGKAWSRFVAAMETARTRAQAAQDGTARAAARPAVPRPGGALGARGGQASEVGQASAGVQASEVDGLVPGAQDGARGEADEPAPGAQDGARRATVHAGATGAGETGAGETGAGETGAGAANLATSVGGGGPDGGGPAGTGPGGAGPGADRPSG